MKPHLTISSRKPPPQHTANFLVPNFCMYSVLKWEKAWEIVLPQNYSHLNITTTRPECSHYFNDTITRHLDLFFSLTVCQKIATLQIFEAQCIRPHAWLCVRWANQGEKICGFEALSVLVQLSRRKRTRGKRTRTGKFSETSETSTFLKALQWVAGLKFASEGFHWFWGIVVLEKKV